MKKFVALMLCLIMGLSVLASCQVDLENEDKGPTIPVYITEEIANFDPAYGNLDDAAMKILGLMYEGLFEINSSGKTVKLQAKSVKVLDDESENYYAIEIKLDNTCWSDGTRVQAADYVYAWKRILESEFRGEAAAMLMGIKNARAVASGDASIDDLGVTDEEIDVLRIEFEGPTDYDKFYEYLASPMLVPLREVAVDKVNKYWSSSATILVSNGPYNVKRYLPGELLLLERNAYYYRNAEEESIRTSVKPYRLEINLGKNAADQYADYQGDAIVYAGNLPLDVRASLLESGDVEVYDTMNMLSCLFNTRRDPFDKKEVRQALSLAVDRNEIVKILTFAKPAQGLIADGVFNVNYKDGDTFREAGKSLISASADVAAAKNLLSQAGVSGGKITITLRNNEADVKVAEYIKSVWEELGFTVTLDAKGYRSWKDEKEYDLVIDDYLDVYDSHEFDVILVDYQMLTTDAFPNLAMFAQKFSGGSMNMDPEHPEYGQSMHISGYRNEAYDAKIEEIFAVYDDDDARAALLHDAEEMLIADMPIMPLVQLKSGVLIHDDLTKVGETYWGFNYFTRTILKNRYNYDETLPPKTEEDE